jgi:hypothetical protein
MLHLTALHTPLHCTVLQVKDGKHPEDKLVPLEPLLEPVIQAIGEGVVSYV